MKDETERKVLEAFRKMDESVEVSAPNVSTISLLLKEKSEEHKRSIKRELRLFLFFATVMTVILLLLLTNAPLVYTVIQIVGVIIVPIYTAMQKRKRNREDTFI